MDEHDGLRGPAFRHSDMLAGLFEEDSLPVVPGTHRYMPFRNLGHLEMVRAVKAGLRPRCTASHGGVRISFEVEAIPEAHVMVIANIHTVVEEG